jgi:hypothetical protein
MFLTAAPRLVAADEEGITWLVTYEGKALPAGAWSASGEKLNAKIEGDGALRLADDGPGVGYYSAPWKAGPGQEIVVEAAVKFLQATGTQKNRTTVSLWPWRDGAPVTVQISDGRHQEGLVLFPTQAASFTDRFIPMDTANKFYTYRLVIRGTDMSMSVDGVQKVRGQNAFWKPADSPEPFIRFGSTSDRATGEALWQSVKLGVRKMAEPPKESPVKITVSEPWTIPRPEAHQTRPYLYDLGEGLLLTSVAQGRDAFYEPYGVLKSTDAGKTWSPVAGLDHVEYAPLPMLRRPDRSIVGVSRWYWWHEDGTLHGNTVHFNADATEHTMHDNTLSLPEEYMPAVKTDMVIAERHIWNEEDGAMTMVVWSRKGMPLPDGRKSTVRTSHLVRSGDNGRTWKYVSTVNRGGEPAVVRVSATEWTAVNRADRNSLMTQVFSHDAGKTWSKPVALEVGKVAPDLVMMSNGVLACSYGRPASCLMFSVDGGRTWASHHVISDRVGFNYVGIREISPGRLLYLHDAPDLRGVYVDVERN